MEKHEAGGNSFLNFLSPFRNQQSDLNQVASPKLQDHLRCLDSAYSRTTQGHNDTPTTRTRISKRPIANVELTPSHYPSKPLRNMNSIQYFMNLDAHTLFFICYYLDGSKAQYLAAKVLKTQSWMYDAEDCKWFKSMELPTLVKKYLGIGNFHYYYDSENMVISRYFSEKIERSELRFDD
ncbi:unnamed protein product [Rodentolepis nana]|uniref:NOT2_3_5 domain-containing protein n=1 Tax=Rodentolepis nana TaxID=102285 RepID=A0A0R3TBM8_RODNA|nr:unnamed protein product [Rodentolepis nana]